MDFFWNALGKVENLAVVICLCVIWMLFHLLKGQIKQNEALTDGLLKTSIISEKLLVLVQAINERVTRSRGWE